MSLKRPTTNEWNALKGNFSFVILLTSYAHAHKMMTIYLKNFGQPKPLNKDNIIAYIYIQIRIILDIQQFVLSIMTQIYVIILGIDIFCVI